jgi:hypothetical protein
MTFPFPVQPGLPPGTPTNLDPSDPYETLRPLYVPIEKLILNQSVNVLVETLKIPSVFVGWAQLKNKNRPATEAGWNMYISLERHL